MLEIKPCPQCGEVPTIGYACGEYFVITSSDSAGTCLCGLFNEMHSSEELEIVEWNRIVNMYNSKEYHKKCRSCIHSQVCDEVNQIELLIRSKAIEGTAMCKHYIAAKDVANIVRCLRHCDYSKQSETNINGKNLIICNFSKSKGDTE